MTADMLQLANILLSRGIAANDQEMINSARKLLNENAAPEAPESSNVSSTPKRGRPRKSKAAELLEGFESAQIEDLEAVAVSENPLSRKRVDINQFKMEDRDDSKKRNGVPVNKVRRGPNQFMDDKTIAIDEKDKTPYIPPVKREREPAQKVEAICTKCGSKNLIDPIHVRETYICEECILGAKKGRR